MSHALVAGRFSMQRGLVFLYFVTLHADQLALPVAAGTIRLNNIIALLLSVLFLLRHRLKFFQIEGKLALALVWLILSLVLSTLFSPFHERALLFLGWFGFTLCCYFLLPYFLIKFYDTRTVVALYFASFLCVGLYAFLQLVLSCFHVIDPFVRQWITSSIARPNALSYEPSFYALYLTPFIVLCNTHFLMTPGESFIYPKRLSFLKVCGINALYLISFSASAFFAYLIFFSCLLFGFKFRKRVFWFCLGFALLILLFFVLFPELIQTFFLKFFIFGFMAHPSFYLRWWGIANGWTIFTENPFFGIGLGSFPPVLYSAYLNGNEKFRFFESQLKEMTLPPLKYFEPTNVLTEVLASLGVFGAAAFGYLLFLFFSRARQAVPWALSLIVMLVLLQFNQGVLRTYIWVHLAICFALFDKSASARETVHV